MSSFFEFYCPVKIISGLKALEHLPFELGLLQASRPLIVTDQGVRKAGLLKILLKAFDESDILIGGVYDNVPADSSLSTVDELADIYTTNSCDALIAVGGGSVMDTAKGTNILVSEKVDDLRKLAGAGILKHPLNPLIAVPTTAGTGSEVTQVAVIADPENQRKIPFVSQFLLPQLAVIDPRMTLTLPPQTTASTAMDAFTHAVEAYTCLAKNPISDAYALAAIKSITEHLDSVIRNPAVKEGRLALANAATMAGIAFSNSMVGVVHTLGHSAGSVAHIPHGTAMSIFLPHVLEYNLQKQGEPYASVLAELAAAMNLFLGSKDKTGSENARAVIHHIRQLKESLYQKTGLPRHLQDTGLVQKQDLEQIARVAMGDASSIYNPAEMAYEDAMYLLQQAYENA